MSQNTLNNPRIAAINTLAEVIDGHKSLSECKSFSHLRDSRDSAFARHLAYGVMRWLVALEWLLGVLLTKPLKQRDRDIRRLALMGLQQLWHDQAASHAIIYETAECARLLGKPWAVGLINAVLRRFQRERQTLLQELEQVPEHLAHPQWLLRQLQLDWPDKWQAIVAANNRQAPLWLRINRQRADKSRLLDRLHTAGFSTADHVYARDALSIDPAAPVENIPGFADGWLSVQDPAAQLARDLIDPLPGERILDACAAPGGKTAHLLETCPQTALTVLDRNTGRIERLRQNLERLGLTAETRVADAADTRDWWNGKKFNKILLDAPCSATGVIRRHPEIKRLRSTGQLDKVIRTQAGLLNALWPLIETGGMLVYATCSILKRENNLQIHQFLQQHADAQSGFPSAEWGTAESCGRQIMPGEEQMDGFFYALLHKSA